MIFKKKHIVAESNSLSALTWKRFKRNKLAMFGLAIIIFCAVISVLGYSITPDATPYANDQKPELHILKPGFKVNVLLVKRNENTENVSFFEKMLFGEKSSYSAYSVYAYRFNRDSIFVEEFTGNSPNKGDTLRFHIAQVIYAIEPSTKMIFDAAKNECVFYQYNQKTPSRERVVNLRSKILASNLVNKKFILGTDLLGRDLLSRLMIGTRISLTVGLISVIISIIIGIFLGSLAGYFRGRIDDVIMWLINVVWSIPTLLLVIAITLVLGKGVTQVFIAVGLTMWVEVARIVRGQVMSIREKEFVEAGRALGYQNSRIIFRHILPNVLGPVVVIAAGNFASAILMEAGLSFLGLGAQPPIPSWGEMTNAHHGYILMDKAYLAFIPGMAIMLLVLAFMLVGNGLRDAMDTRAVDDKPLI
ncbi:MAG: ABC transporter permease [Bacteroidota bacterium]